MRWKNSLIPAVALSLIACGSLDSNQSLARSRSKTVELPPADAAPPEAVKIGAPYEAGGQSYAPKDEVNYDEVGYASWYGEELRGSNTGNGEVFNPDGITAAHRTLPMPSYVEVTDLQTGRTILARVNDRGPFKKDRIIDLSAGAAAQLGVTGQGHVPVRVRRVNPPEYEKRALASGGKAVERLPTPPGLLNALKLKLKDQPVPKEAMPVKTASAPTPKPKPVVKAPPPAPPKPQAGADFPPPGSAPVAAPPAPAAKGNDRFIVEEAGQPHWRKRAPEAAMPKAPAPKPAPVAAGNWYIQAAAFSSEANARAAATKLGGAQLVQAGNIWRVRTGPYASEAAARAALGGVRTKGYADARVTR